MRELKLNIADEEITFDLDTQVKVIEKDYDFRQDEPLKYLYITANRTQNGFTTLNFLDVYHDKISERFLLSTGKRLDDPDVRDIVYDKLEEWYLHKIEQEKIKR